MHSDMKDFNCYKCGTAIGQHNNHVLKIGVARISERFRFQCDVCHRNNEWYPSEQRNNFARVQKST
jgi:hypothetical protein